MKLKQAESEVEIKQARELFEEYAAWLDVDLCFQNFEKELRELPGEYAKPSGRLLLAIDGGQLMGCVALRRIDDDICEMKRLYLRKDFRGRGAGRELAVAIIEEARQIGYQRMRLDTLPRRMAQAETVYRSLGFKEIEPYYHNPIGDTLYMELVL
ncbi:MAG: GNAT family N-acetyltransferase [Pyrinomonadaceae bacterium]|nr:GNAT family N-acetyltransferase [Pyrinomonadaceae bacterium]